MNDNAALRCIEVSASYDRKLALERVTGAFGAGSLTAVTGPNGAGKTTLLRAIMGEVPLAGGAIERGVDMRQIAYLPQAAEIDRRFPLTVFDAVAPGLWREIGVFRGLTRAHSEQVERVFETVGLAGLQKRRIGTLSAGQFQRVLFARLLLQDAPVILLDEPFAAVDEQTTEELLALVHGWHEAGRTVVAVLHDLSQVRRFFPQTLLLARKVVAWGPTAAALSSDNIARARRLAGQWDATDKIPDLRLTA